MYSIPKKFPRILSSSPLVLVVLIVESIKSLSPLPRGRRHVAEQISLPCPEDVGTLSNFVKFVCCDCFSLLVAVPVVLVVSPAASSLRQVGRIPQEWLLCSPPLRTTSGIRASQVRRGIIY